MMRGVEDNDVEAVGPGIPHLGLRPRLGNGVGRPFTPIDEQPLLVHRDIERPGIERLDGAEVHEPPNSGSTHAETTFLVPSRFVSNSAVVSAG